MKYKLPADQSPVARKADPAATEKNPREPFFTPPENAAGFFPPAGGLTAKAPVHSQPPVIQKKEGPLPNEVQAKMESSFGEDFSNVSVQTNSQKAVDLNALAFTQGEEIHFAPGQYNTRTREGQKLIGHELAHVTQQRAGIVQPTIQSKGVNINDDSALEKQADAMGEKAASSCKLPAYQSAALAIRHNLRTVQRAARGVVQRTTVPTWYGEFEDKTYKPFKDGAKTTGVEMLVEFRPGNNVNAEKIGLTQTIRETLGGRTVSIDPATSTRVVDKGFAEGTAIDRISSRNTPIYGSASLPAGTGLEGTAIDNNPTAAPTQVGVNATYQLGFHFKDKAGALQHQNAQLHDTPHDPGRDKNAGQVFETTALALKGGQLGMYYGSVEWGWQSDAKGVFTQLPFKLVSKGMPSERFMEAAKAWNAAKTMGTLKTTADPTSVFNGAFASMFTVPKDTTVTILDQGSFWTHNDRRFSHVTVAEGAHAGKDGLVRVNDMKDQGDGTATVDLPLVTEIYSGPYDDILDIAPVAQVNRDTKVKMVDDTDPLTAYVEVMEGSFRGTRGYVNKIGGLPFKNVER